MNITLHTYTACSIFWKQMEPFRSLLANSWNLLESYRISKLGRCLEECSRICGVSGANLLEIMKYIDMYIYIYVNIYIYM